MFKKLFCKHKDKEITNKFYIFDFKINEELPYEIICYKSLLCKDCKKEFDEKIGKFVSKNIFTNLTNRQFIESLGYVEGK